MNGGADPTEMDLAEALEELEQARAEARPSAISKALLRVGQLHSTRLEAEPALAAFQEVRAMGVRLDRRYDVAAADDLTGLLLCHLGEPARALDLHRQAAAAFAELSTPDDESLARSFAAWALLEMDRAEEALAESMEAERLDPGSGLGGTIAICLAELGRLDEAQLHVSPRDTARHGAFAWFARVEAHVAARAGRTAEATRAFAEALAFLSMTGDLAEHSCCVREMARLGLWPAGPEGGA